MKKEKMYIPFDTLEAFMAEALMGVGVPKEDAKICADILISSDKRGIDSHGIGRLKPIYYDRIKKGIQEPVTNFEVVKDTFTTAVIDGHDGMGHVIAKRAMQMAIDKAKVYGMGMTVVRNSTHYGFAGYYPLMAIDNNMIGMTGTNARPSIAPTFGVENMLGTNPITVGVPSDEAFPFVLDCATSVSQRGKIEVYDREGKDLPDGWVIDREGQSRTDTKQILVDLVEGNAALTPLGGIGEETGGYKGYGYATFVEILSAALQGGSFLKGLLGFDALGQARPYHLGHFFIAINIENFIEPHEFKKITGDILRDLRASDKMPGEKHIYTAGEKEYDAWLERKDKGAPMNDALIKNILDIKAELGLSDYHFPFEK